MNTLNRKDKKAKSKKNRFLAIVKTKEEMLKSFFGKLPKIGDGLEYQKKIRNEW